MRTFLKKAKDLKFTDFLAGFKFLAALIPALLFKIYLNKNGRKFWLICEEPMEAQDNGWAFFRYMNHRHPEIETIYAIKKEAPMYKKVKHVGETVDYGSVKHWIYYLCAEVNISSQKGGKPNAAICYVLEVYGLLKNKRVFLQHGVIMNDCDYLHYKNTKMWMFITASEEETRFVREKFGYPYHHVVCTGLSRFDYLKNQEPVDEKYVLLMPTWRYWLKLPSKISSSTSAEYADFMESEYYKVFQRFITDEEVIKLLNKYNYRLIFYPHRNIQKHIHCFKTTSNRVELASSQDYAIQKLLCKSSLMITDYSSVTFDFAYLRKPMIYFQFDVKRFRKYQYCEGYFSYEKDGFGPVCYDYDSLIKNFSNILSTGISEQYREREQTFFKYSDHNNSERIYREIKERL